MALKAPIGGGKDFERLKSGSYFAICDQVVDLGMQPGSGMYPKPRDKVFLRFEVPEERVEWTDKDGNTKNVPQTIGSTYTLSMHENAQLRAALEGWRGQAFTDEQAEDFDISLLLGKTCMIVVTETEKNGKTYANITSIGKLPKGVPPPVPELPLLYYSERDTELSNKQRTDVFRQLPEWLQKKIEGQLAPEKVGDSTRNTDADFDDDIGF